jgi:hypothetical protein
LVEHSSEKSEHLVRKSHNEDDDDWPGNDDDYDDIANDDDDEGYVPCPHCGETMLEVADYCPSCRRWITTEDRPVKPRSGWMVILILILLFTIVFSVLPR